MAGLGFSIPVLAARRNNETGPAPFSPNVYTPTVFFDPSQGGSLFQDVAGTTAVTTDGQPVGLWQDQTANAVNLKQTDTPARPTFKTDGARQWLEMDGIDDGMLTDPVFDIENPTTMVLGYQMVATSGTARVNLAELSRTSTNGMSLGVRPNIDRLQFYSRMSQNGVSSSNVVSPSIFGGHLPHVVTVQSVAGHVTARLDGVTVIDASQALSTEAIATQPLRIGRGVITGSTLGAFRLFGVQLWASAATQPSLAQIETLEQWMADRMGITL